MKIDSYAVHTSAQRSYQKLEMQSTQLSLTGARGRPAAAEDGVVVTLSDLAQQMMEETRQNAGKAPTNSAAASAGEVGATGATPMSKEELKLKLLENMLSSISGRRVRLQMANPAGRHHPFARGGAGMRGFSGAELKVQSLQYEHESVSYQAQGLVKTADGQNISIDLSLSMSRTFLSASSTTLSFAANPIDPLVINYGGTAASLSGEKFAFDLDFDGTLDQISFAGPGSGFLALDKNGDGKINDGSELFGPASGSGFGELRTHDKDGNGWIDENDAVFEQLRIWSRDADGKDQLFTLKELGIGAIYLGDVATRFSMNDAANNTHGIMRSTSFFLREDGGAGTVHHIDLMA